LKHIFFYFETQKAQKSTKGFHKSFFNFSFVKSFYVKKNKNFCEALLCSFVPFVFQKKEKKKESFVKTLL